MKFQRSRKLVYSLTLMLIFFFYTSSAYPTYQEYLKKFHKTYSSSEQYSARQAIYNQNLKKFQTIKNFIPGVNEMTDWTPSEIKSRKNLIVLQNVGTNNTNTQLPTNTFVGGSSSPPGPNKDWRVGGYITSVKNQAQCGDCFAFATVATAESFVIINGRFSNQTINLSQQYILSCSLSNNSCSGGTLQAAMTSGLNIPSQANYPYNPFANHDYNDICNITSGLKIANTNVNDYKINDDKIISYLQSTPLAISVSAQGWEHYQSGLLSCSNTYDVDHAVQLIGYTPQYWIIKNQWGTCWGIDGFAYVTRNVNSNCLIGNSVHFFTDSPAINANIDDYFIDTSPSTDTNNTCWQFFDRLQNKLMLLAFIVVLLIQS